MLLTTRPNIPILPYPPVPVLPLSLTLSLPFSPRRLDKRVGTNGPHYRNHHHDTVRSAATSTTAFLANATSTAHRAPWKGPTRTLLARPTLDATSYRPASAPLPSLDLPRTHASVRAATSTVARDATSTVPSNSRKTTRSRDESNTRDQKPSALPITLLAPSKERLALR